MCQKLAILIVIFFFVAHAIPLSEKTLGNLELMRIPLDNGKELDLLSLTDETGKLSDRNKRTIGILRDLFPELTEQVDQSVNKLVSQLIRIVGPAVLRGAVRNNPSTVNSRNSFNLDFEDSQENDKGAEVSSTGSVRVELPTFDEDEEDEKITTTSEKPILQENSSNSISNRRKRKSQDETRKILPNESLEMNSSTIEALEFVKEKGISVTRKESLACNGTDSKCSKKTVVKGKRNN